MITLMGIMHEQQKLPNQDMGVMLSDGGSNGLFAACVFDGHGDDGHEISDTAAKIARAEISRLFKEGERDVSKIVSETFKIANAGVDKHPKARNSGCTGSIAVVIGSQMASGNVGDSSIVLMSTRKASLYPRFVSTDHRLDEPSERARIVENGGIIYEDQYVVDKVEKNKGLMVTRTMGDVDMRPNGVICEPEIKTMAIEQDDRWIVVASDGLWDEDGMSFQYACSVASKALRKDIHAVPKELLKSVSQDGPADDCTIVVIAL
eukprot:CAMPEP_0182441762 /NCGR_PEP_ID=MMETSP1172-20130603/768_1 /TAXON_ID=708627 /ORGANISM="Timspurckia oligopyrenoides, Strain CCMP3278" /LENGTH=262 /DNA_ID=CAMNT_0024636283 /DNA_START=205 /DNA_END=993 /DNA_ORIENTATION=+